jgi:hypothetical protein
MHLKIILDSPMPEWRALQCARLMCDVQHLCLFALYLADDHEVFSEFNFFDDQSQKYEFMIIADTHEAVHEFGKSQLLRSAVALTKFKFESPPEIEVAIKHPTEIKGKLAKVLEFLKGIILFEAQQRKMDAQTEILRQQGISQALKNIEHGLKIADKIKDNEDRQIFMHNLRSAIVPFMDGRHPPVRVIEVIEK